MLKKRYISICISFFILLTIACKKKPADITPANHAIIGFNLKWRNFPALSNQAMINNINLLKPKILRYPGGSVAHIWNWHTGLPVTPIGSDIIHPITDLALLRQKINVDFMFVLDVVNSSLQDQIDMLHAANVPIRYIELGNELYSDEYETKFPTGKEYADTVNSWIPALAAEFPDVKISAVMIGKAVATNKTRQIEWNSLVHANIHVPIQAYSYHFYIAENETLSDRIARFEAVFIKNSNKETWVTEYSSMDLDLQKILSLADYVDSIANISMNHCLYTPEGSFSKLTADGNALTQQGEAFRQRVN